MTNKFQMKEKKVTERYTYKRFVETMTPRMTKARIRNKVIVQDRFKTIRVFHIIKDLKSLKRFFTAMKF